MAHKTLVGGTAYEITGGKTLIGGTAYSLKNGKVLISGTAYDIGFISPVIVKVIIPPDSGCSVTIDGIEYTESGTYEALESVSVMVNGYFSGPPSYVGITAYVFLNSAEVASANGITTPSTSYSLSLEGYSEVTIKYSNENSSSVYNCYIFQVPEDYALITLPGGGIDYNKSYIVVDGVTYNETDAAVLTVPIGTAILCYVKDPHGSGDPHIQVNGVRVFSGEGTYNYTVIGHATIIIHSNTYEDDGDDTKYSYGAIMINEE